GRALHRAEGRRAPSVRGRRVLGRPDGARHDAQHRRREERADGREARSDLTLPMASLAARLPDNAPGDFYVDRTCIDCATCRRIAPDVVDQGDGHSYVRTQPGSDRESRRALMALVACPTASIGTVRKTNASAAAAAFPETVAENVSFCGFTAESSFGAWSY